MTQCHQDKQPLLHRVTVLGLCFCSLSLLSPFIVSVPAYTGLIISFLVSSLRPLGFHLFTCIFINYGLKLLCQDLGESDKLPPVCLDFMASWGNGQVNS